MAREQVRKKQGARHDLLEGFRSPAANTKSPVLELRNALRHADEHSGRHFPDRGLFSGWLAGTANGSGSRAIFVLPCGRTNLQPKCLPTALNWGFRTEPRLRGRFAPNRGETHVRPGNPVVLWPPRRVRQSIQRRSGPEQYSALPSCFRLSTAGATTSFSFYGLGRSAVRCDCPFFEKLVSRAGQSERENVSWPTLGHLLKRPGCHRVRNSPGQKPDETNRH